MNPEPMVVLIDVGPKTVRVFDRATGQMKESFVLERQSGGRPRDERRRIARRD